MKGTGREGKKGREERERKRQGNKRKRKGSKEGFLKQGKGKGGKGMEIGKRNNYKSNPKKSWDRSYSTTIYFS